MTAPYPGDGDPNSSPYTGPPPTGEPYPPPPPPAYYPPPPMYGYGYPAFAPRGPLPPGVLTSSSVLAYIGAGLLIFAGLVLLLGASLVFDITAQMDADETAVGAELAFDGLVNFVAAGLLIAGGVRQTTSPTGRALLTAGAVLTVLAGFYWLIRLEGFSTVLLFFELLFVTCPVVAVILSWQRAANDWYRTRGGTPAY